MDNYRNYSAQKPNSKNASSCGIETGLLTPTLAVLPSGTNVISSSPPEAYDAPPNGGLLAWLQIMGGFFLLFNSWGIVNTYGVYQTYYGIRFADQSPSNISWVGSIQSFLVLIVGVLAGPLYDVGHFQALIVSGTFLVAFGMMMTSICSQFWQIVLAQGICVGIGCGCLYIPSVAIIPQYFTTRRALATGIASSGSSLGGMIYPIVFRQLQPRIGFGWATRVLGFLSLATCLVSILVMRDRHSKKPTRSLIELSAFKELPYSFFCAALFFGYVGLFIPIFYIQSYAVRSRVANQIPVSYLLSILNAASIPGRIVPGYVALYIGIGHLDMHILASTIAGILALCWTTIHNAAGIVGFAVLYGFFSGGFVSLSTIALTSLTPDYSKLGTRMGMAYVVCSFGSLLGSPVAGAILNSTGHYLGAQLFSGLTIITTGVLLLCARVAKTGFKFMDTV